MKYHFSEAGVIELNDHLATQTDQYLQEQAADIQNNFPNWLKETFVFSTAQTDYLDALNEVFLEGAAHNLSVAVAKRLPITLVKPEFAAARSAQPTGSKLIRDASMVSVTAGTGTEYSAIGEAIFEINYNN